MWVTGATARELRSLLGSLDAEALSSAVVTTIRKLVEGEVEPETDSGVAESLLMTKRAYEALSEHLEAVSDEHLMQLLVKALRTVQ